MTSFHREVQAIARYNRATMTCAILYAYVLPALVSALCTIFILRDAGILGA